MDQELEISEGLVVFIINRKKILEIAQESVTPSMVKFELMKERWECSYVRDMHRNAPRKLVFPNPNAGLQKDGFYLLSETQVTEILLQPIGALTGQSMDRLIGEYSELFRTFQSIIIRRKRGIERNFIPI
jgi:DNA gyrase/topoisomerase IV subunit A